MSWEEKLQNEQDYLDALQRYADAFQDLVDALERMEHLNDEMYDANVEHNAYLRSQQSRDYDKNNDLIKELKNVIFGS